MTTHVLKVHLYELVESGGVVIEHPLAGTILYRALLDDILVRSRSKAYGHGARHLKQLGLLAQEAEADAAWPAGIETHAAYLSRLKSVHSRKTGFWSKVTATAG